MVVRRACRSLSVWKNTAACVSHLLEAQCARAQVHDLPAHRPELARRRAFVVGIGHPRRELSLRDGPRISSSRRAASRRAASRRVHANANRAFTTVSEDKSRRRKRRRRSSLLSSSSSSSSSSSFFREIHISRVLDLNSQRRVSQSVAETLFDDPSVRLDPIYSVSVTVFSPLLRRRSIDLIATGDRSGLTQGQRTDVYPMNRK